MTQLDKVITVVSAAILTAAVTGAVIINNKPTPIPLYLDGGIRNSLSLTVFEATQIHNIKGKPYRIKSDNTMELVDQFPCAWKKKGAKCFLADGGNPQEYETLMPGQFQGPGCTPKACSIFGGQEEDEDGNVK